MSDSALTRWGLCHIRTWSRCTACDEPSIMDTQSRSPAPDADKLVLCAPSDGRDLSRVLPPTAGRDHILVSTSSPTHSRCTPRTTRPRKINRSSHLLPAESRNAYSLRISLHLENLGMTWSTPAVTRSRPHPYPPHPKKVEVAVQSNLEPADSRTQTLHPESCNDCRQVAYHRKECEVEDKTGMNGLPIR